MKKVLMIVLTLALPTAVAANEGKYELCCNTELPSGYYEQIIDKNVVGATMHFLINNVMRMCVIAKRNNDSVGSGRYYGTVYLTQITGTSSTDSIANKGQVCHEHEANLLPEGEF